MTQIEAGTDRTGRDGEQGGWCNYCPAYTYHRLTAGACGECVARFREFPQAAPAGWRDPAGEEGP